MDTRTHTHNPRPAAPHTAERPPSRAPRFTSLAALLIACLFVVTRLSLLSLFSSLLPAHLRLEDLDEIVEFHGPVADSADEEEQQQQQQQAGDVEETAAAAAAAASTS